MPNRYQLAFLASFVGIFGGLVLLSSFIKARLRAAGYDISQLILIGLPKDDIHPPPQQPAWLSSPRTNMFAQLLALILAVVTSAAMYYKFGASVCFLPVYVVATYAYAMTCQSARRC